MLPTGTVTFLFTDIEGSTVRWEDSPAQMRAALDRHNAIMRDAIERHEGVLFETAGDSFVVAFESAPPALAAAVWAQRELQQETWPSEIGALRVRMTLHTGPAEMRSDGYSAQHTLSRQARLLSITHGDQILVSDAAHSALGNSGPDGVELRDLGEVWLKDLIEPEQVFQVVASRPPWSLPAEFPPLRSVRAQSPNLPTAPIPFIGREHMLDEVTRAVTVGSSRVTTLLGPGGMGKTRLALRTAERVQHHFANGVYFVDLAPVTEPALAMSAIAAAIGAGDEVGSDTAALAQLLRDRELLLVLDNLEQVIDVAIDVAELLSLVPGLRVLATSRTPLRILEEAEYPVSPLDLPALNDEASVETIAQSDAVGLFVARSKASSPDFLLAADNAADIAAICHRLEGIPLALVLAAARSRALTPAEMLERLEHRLSMLTDGARDLPVRHQTLHDTVEWSYDLLDEAERSLYARLSVHSGGFRLDAAEAIADSLDVTAGIEALLDASLIQSVETADGGVRYRMLETIGEHARAKLDEDGAAADTENRHAWHFLQFAEEAALQLEGEHIAEWGARLDEEHDNVRAALGRLDRSAEQGDPHAIRSLVRMAAAMGLFWLDRGHLTEGRGHLERGAKLAQHWLDTARDDTERSAAWQASAEIADARGLIARRRNELVDARRWIEEAIQGYRASGDAVHEGLALISLGTLSFHAGDHDEARVVYNRGLALSRSANNRNTASALLSLGNLERDAGNHELARSLYEQSLAIDQATHDLIGESVSINNLANLALSVGEFDRARSLHMESLEIRHRVGARMMLAESMVGIALVEAAAGRLDRAARFIGFAEGLAELAGGEFDPMERRLHAQAVETLSTGLDQDTFTTERKAGRLMTDAEAVEYARSS